MISFVFPLPPTINHYYGQSRSGRRFIKARGVAFRKSVAEIVSEAGHERIDGRVALYVAIHPATRARQDLDNRAKSLQDALTQAGVWLDDEQIDELHMVRQEVIKGGLVRVVIREFQREGE